MADEVLRLGYSSSSNISFRGEIVCHGVTVEDFNEMDAKDQQEVIEEQLYQLVDIYPTNAEQK